MCFLCAYIKKIYLQNVQNSRKSIIGVILALRSYSSIVFFWLFTNMGIEAQTENGFEIKLKDENRGGLRPTIYLNIFADFAV